MRLEILSKNQRQLIELNYAEWKTKEITAFELMKSLEVSKNTFYKIIKEYEEIQ